MLFCAATLALVGLAVAVHADCCKIPIVQLPPDCTTIDQLINKNPDKKPDLAGNQGTPGGTGGGTDAVAGSTDSDKPDEGGGTNLLDGGSAVASSRAFFKEPSQMGVIAWNGKEEILVLTTQEQATQKASMMLSFMPLPGKPIDIKKGDTGLYDRAFKLVQNKLATSGSTVSRNVVVMERKIGPHNIFVWRVDNASQFKNKVQSYVRGKFGDKAAALFNKKTDDVVQSYLKTGFRYFAFDLVLVSDKPKSEKTAIEYHFESPDYLYYPLYISRGSGTGETRVELVVFTDKAGVNAMKGKLRFADEDNQNGELMTLGKKSVTVGNAELGSLHRGMADLFGGRDVRGRIWVLRGKMDSFPGDIMAYRK
jgi:hypothetical protein